MTTSKGPAARIRTLVDLLGETHNHPDRFTVEPSSEAGALEVKREARAALLRELKALAPATTPEE